MIDTHSHIHGREYIEDFQEVLGRASAAGVEKIALVGVHPDDVDRALEVAAAHAGRIFVVAGQHPHEAKDWDEGVKQRLKDQITANPGVIVAVGEMGLDYHYDFAPKDAQKMAFRGQLELAREVDLPIVIHCREAYDDCLEILREFYGSEPAGLERPRGVLHCYFGTAEQARESVAMGFMLGIGGACTFKKADELHRVVTELPLESFVLETDAPYMAPVPYRGKRNEPGYLSHVTARIGELKGVDAVVVAEATTANAKRLYRWA
jgi:TatD DNase family protein